MNYLTTYYWQHSKTQDSGLLLQQLKGKRNEQSVLLAVVCQVQDCPSATEYVLTKLLDWFRRTGLKACKKRGENGYERLQSALKNIVTDVIDDVSKIGAKEKLNMTGLLCVEEKLWCFGWGKSHCYLLQTRFNRSCIRRLDEIQKGWMRCGDVQEGIGVVIGTAPFFATLRREELEQCLAVRELYTEKQMEKRLQELGTVAAERSGACGVAIMIKC
ncbi:MAG: hypothetical protein IJ833_03085 [Lachnospiraceae bacterium]|nr:hypothetical protein [Lachnospiraceae bacterium]